MITPSTNYLDKLNSCSLSPKIKIVADDVEYLGDVIKSSPKINHSSSRIVGSFPIKTASFEIFNLNDDIDFIGKEVYIYKGLFINDSIEYIPQGIFTPQIGNVQTNISTKTVSFNDIQDRTQFLEDKYISNLNWENNAKHSGLEIVTEICQKKNFELENKDFAFADYMFPQPNFSENISNRQVIASIAEIGGETAFFNAFGKLAIKKQSDTNISIKRKRYQKLSKEKEIVINTVVLGKKGIDDDCVYPETLEEERVEIRIEDNPFVDLIRAEIVKEVAKNIIGLTYIPYELNDFIDGYIFELNDVINIEDRDGNSVRAVILDLKTNNRLRSNLSLKSDAISNTNYALAGSTQQQMNQVRLEVDHANKEVRSLAESVKTLDNAVTDTKTAVKQTSEQLSTLASKTETMETDVSEALSSASSALDIASENQQSLETTDKTLQSLKENSVDKNQMQKFEEEISTRFTQQYNAFQFDFNDQKKLLSDIQKKVNENISATTKYIRFEDGAIILGQSESPMKVRITNTEIQFLQNDQKIAYLSNNTLYITNSIALTSIKIGNFQFTAKTDGSLSFGKVGG